MDTQSALVLVLITVGAVAMPGVARRLSIPVAVAEIVYGMIIGVSGLRLTSGDTSFIQFLGDLGFAFFMFLAGLEIDFASARRRGPVTLLLASFLATSSLGLGVFLSQGQGWGIWVGLAVGATSVPLLLAVVRELRLGNTELGATMILFAAVGEAFTIVALSLVEVQHEAHGAVDLLLGIARLVSLALIVLLVGALFRTLLWWYPRPFARLVAFDDPSEIGVRVGFGLMFGFIGMSVLFGIEPFLGAFIAGAVLTFVLTDKGALEHKLSSMAYGFFVPVFFIDVGMHIEISLDLVWNNGPQILLVVGFLLLVKLVPALILLFRGVRLTDLFATTCLLAAPLTLFIAIVELGTRVGEVDPSFAGILVTGGIAGSLIYPSVARILLRGASGGDWDEPSDAGEPTEPLYG